MISKDIQRLVLGAELPGQWLDKSAPQASPARGQAFGHTCPSRKFVLAYWGQNLTLPVAVSALPLSSYAHHLHPACTIELCLLPAQESADESEAIQATAACRELK